MYACSISFLHVVPIHVLSIAVYTVQSVDVVLPFSRVYIILSIGIEQCRYRTVHVYTV